MSTVSDDGDSWVDHLRGIDWHDNSTTLSDKYLVSLYYTITTIATVGYGDVTPRNTYERMFSIAAMIVGGAFYGAP
jgi:hypothetical protein